MVYRWYLLVFVTSNTNPDHFLNLCIDIGNTRTKAAIFEQGLLVRQFYAELKEIWSDKKLINKVEGVIMSSTKSILSIDEIPTQIKNKIVLDHHTPIPIENLYATPETLGRDRLAAVVGANALYPKSLSIVIDAGTCITFDIINNEQYLGGNISPGIRMRAQAMHDYTGLLPNVDIAYHADFIGKNTEQALQNGAVLGTIFEIDSFIASIIDKYKVEDINVILTGGDADFLAKHVKSKIFVEENIVLMGLHEILKHNAH